MHHIGKCAHTHAQSPHLQSTFPWLEMWWDSQSTIASLCRCCPSGTVDHSSNLHLSSVWCLVSKMLFLNILWIKLYVGHRRGDAYLPMEMLACDLRKKALVNFDHIFSCCLLWFPAQLFCPLTSVQLPWGCLSSCLLTHFHSSTELSISYRHAMVSAAKSYGQAVSGVCILVSKTRTLESALTMQLDLEVSFCFQTIILQSSFKQRQAFLCGD